MSRIVYVNGQYVDESSACISVFDRGFLFADAVYEVTAVIDGKLIDNKAHLERLTRSRNELAMSAPCSDEQIVAIQRRLLELNQLEEGLVYLQLTRGAVDRDFAVPQQAKPGLVLFTQAKSLRSPAALQRGIRVVTQADIRWRRRDIKTVQLLAPSLAKQAALDQGVDDAWLVEDGYVNEGTSNNAWIITADGVLKTRHAGCEILNGITRRAVLSYAEAAGYSVDQSPFSVAEAQSASEAFITSASVFVMPVVEIDGVQIGTGLPGVRTLELRRHYVDIALAEAD